MLDLEILYCNSNFRKQELDPKMAAVRVHSRGLAAAHKRGKKEIEPGLLLLSLFLCFLWIFDVNSLNFIAFWCSRGC